MERIPRAVLDTLEDLYKRHSISPRDYPGVHIHWQGCGDSGGVEEINFLTPEGVQYAKQYGYAPPNYHMGEHPTGPRKYYFTSLRKWHNGETRHSVVSVDDQHGDDYTIGEYIYNAFNVCEINDGGYAHAFIEMPHGKLWGESFDWVSEERSNTCVSYED